jgi:hypothetical protein
MFQVEKSFYSSRQKGLLSVDCRRQALSLCFDYDVSTFTFEENLQPLQGCSLAMPVKIYENSEKHGYRGIE